MEHQASRGDSPPLHVHRNEDEVFHLLEGELCIRLGHRDLRASAGETLIAPEGLPHTYRIESETARWLTVTTGEDFERLVRTFGRVAERDGLPDLSGPPTPEQARELAAACLRHGIELVGPPPA